LNFEKKSDIRICLRLRFIW